MPEPVEAQIRGVLDANWYRLSRYDSPEQAAPAIANVAQEIAALLADPTPGDRLTEAPTLTEEERGLRDDLRSCCVICRRAADLIDRLSGSGEQP